MTTASEASAAKNFYCHSRSIIRAGSLTWTVEGLANVFMFGTETIVWTSPEFPIPGSESVFSVEVKTKTDTSAEEGYVGLFLHYLRGPRDCTTYCYFSLITSSNSKSHMKSFCTKFSKYTSHSGLEKFITRKELIDQKLIRNNEVTVSCCVVALEEPQVSELYSRQLRAKNVHSERSSLPEEWKSFYDQKLNTDVVLKVAGEQFMAHKAVLMCRSPVFHAMLHHDMQEKISNEVVIQDVDSDVFQELLRYMYTDDFPPRNPGLVAKLMVAADKYDMQPLKSRCSDYLCDYVRPSNMLDMLKFAELCSSSELDEACLSVVNHEVFPATCVIDCMKRMKDLPQVLDLLKKRFVVEDLPTEQNKRHCPDS